MTIEPTLQHELDRFDPGAPVEEALTPPSSWYTAPEFESLERDRVFRRSWQCVGRGDQLRKTGDYLAGVVAGEPFVVVRGEDGADRAFLNVCRHHATQVTGDEAGCTKELVCPYHGWTYGLDGRLVRAPGLGAVRDFDRDRFGLVPARLAQWGPLLFVWLGDDPRQAANDLAPLEDALDADDISGLRFVKRVRYRLDCNWKVYVDNYLDGGYHVAHLHQGLAAQLDLSSYRTELFDRGSVQRAGGAAGNARVGEDFGERIGDRAAYVYLYPNFMINRYGSIMDTNLVLPLGPDRAEVVFDYYFSPNVADDEEFVTRSLTASDVVQQEDTGICERVQVGLRSSAYDQGRYAAPERAAHHFHRLLAADLRRGIAPD